MKKLEELISHNIAINSIEKDEDSSTLKVKLLVHDFKKSHNGWGITEEVADKNKHTLVGKHIVTKYYRAEENGGKDCLGDHEEGTTKYRDTDVDIPLNYTNSIGTITNAYIDWIDGDNEELGKALWADGILLMYEHYNECSLIYEWYENNIKVNTSVEWFYTDDVIVDGVQWIANPTYSNIAVLNSESRGDTGIIYGNYDTSELKLMINQMNNAIKADYNEKVGVNNNSGNNKDGDNVEKINIFKQALNQLSLGQTRDKIFDALSKVMVADEYNSMWLGNYGIYDDHIIYETYIDNGWKNFKINYSKSEDDEITFDMGTKVEVDYEFTLVEKTTVDTMQSSLNSLTEKVETISTEKVELETSLNAKDDEIKGLKGEMTADKDMIVSLNEQINSLNEKIEELEPFKIDADKQEYEKALNELKDVYKEKFEKLNALEVFDSEEVQLKIERCMNSDTKVDAELSIKTKLCDLISGLNVNKTVEPTPIVEQSKSLNGLKPNTSKFEENYGFAITE